MVRILSIDLPWSESSKSQYGFAAYDGNGNVYMAVKQNSPDLEKIYGEDEGLENIKQIKSFDIILIDHPIAEDNISKKSYRRIERAIMNSVFIKFDEGKNIQGPRMQKGMENINEGKGMAHAEMALEAFGLKRTMVIESFPQLTIMAMLEHDKCLRNYWGKVLRAYSLNPHKGGCGAAALSLVNTFKEWTGLEVVWNGVEEGQPDAVDALLALIPALKLIGLESESQEWSRIEPCWLNSYPDQPMSLPSEVEDKKEQRNKWLSRVTIKKDGWEPGIKTDGLLGLCLGEWKPEGKERIL